MQPTVSIITPYRNAEKFLSRFVSSIQAQSRTDWVCIMVDDGSTDNGPQELKYLVREDPRFLLLKNSFHKSWPGPASARNFALAHTKTELIAFCDVDDLWHPDKLERQLSFHLSNNLDLSVTAYARFCEDYLDEPLTALICPPQNLNLDNLTSRNVIPMLTVVMSSDLARVGFKQVAHEDFLFWLELFRSNQMLKYGCLPLVLSFYCVHGTNHSGSKLSMPFWTYRVYRSYGHARGSSVLLLVRWVLEQAKCRFLRDLISQPPKSTVRTMITGNPVCYLNPPQ